MEPKQPAPNIGPEFSPVDYGRNLERAPMPPSPEVTPERNPERFEQRSEATPVVVMAPPVLPTPVVTLPADDTVTAVTDDNAMPAVASDDDLIEKEWVDKAKKIITQTKDDPYRREHEVGKLQADYLRKRYGRELGASQ